MGPAEKCLQGGRTFGSARPGVLRTSRWGSKREVGSVSTGRQGATPAAEMQCAESPAPLAAVSAVWRKGDYARAAVRRPLGLETGLHSEYHWK